MHFKLTSNPFESVGMKGVRLRGFKIQIEAQPLDRNSTLPVVLTSLSGILTESRTILNACEQRVRRCRGVRGVS